MLKEEKQILWRTSAVCLGVALPLMLMGRAVTAACVAVGLFLGLFATKGNSLRSSIRYFLNSTPLRLVLGVLAAYGLTSAFAIDPNYSGEYLVQLTGISIFAMLLYLVLREMPSRHVQLLLQSMFIATMVMIFLALLDASLNDPRLAQALHGRKAGNVSRLNYYSSVLAVLLPFLWAWLIRRYNENEVLTRKVGPAIAVIAFLAVFICGGRAGWVAAFVSVPVFLFYAVRLGEVKMKLKHWAVVVAAFVAGPLSYALIRGVGQVGDRVMIWQEKGGAGSGRLGIWEFAIQHFQDNPITGIGLNSFRLLDFPAEPLASTAHPHNFVIQLFLETGAVGFAATMLLFLWVLRTFYIYAKGNLFGAATLASLLAFFGASLFNTSIFQTWWLVFFVFVAILGGRVGWTSDTQNSK